MNRKNIFLKYVWSITGETKQVQEVLLWNCMDPDKRDTDSSDPSHQNFLKVSYDFHAVLILLLFLGGSFQRKHERVQLIFSGGIQTQMLNWRLNYDVTSMNCGKITISSSKYLKRIMFATNLFSLEAEYLMRGFIYTYSVIMFPISIRKSKYPECSYTIWYFPIIAVDITIGGYEWQYCINRYQQLSVGQGCHQLFHQLGAK